MIPEYTRQSIPLSALLEGIAVVASSDDVDVSDIALDSRDIGPGACFFALQGTRENGVKYARDAVSRGAAAIIAEDEVPVDVNIPVVAVAALHRHVGLIARRFFGDPSSFLEVFAVTGTNGKSTVAHLTAQALNGLGARCGYIGTLGAGEIGDLEQVNLTTPDVIALNRWIARMRDSGFMAVALEASSHALAQRRLDGIRLRAAAFTNLGHDHLDYHGDLESYARSKKLLFDRADLGAAIVNVDDPLGAEIAAVLESGMELWTCSSRGAQADVVATDVVSVPEGITFTLNSVHGSGAVRSRIAGRFNIDNLLITGAYLLSLGYMVEQVCSAISNVRAVSGRMEYCGRTNNGARVFVDYAHSPDSLRAALLALREFEPAKLIVVFGCGGSRDRSKRALMGAVAESLADRIVLTADNPRAEDNADIVAEIAAGMQQPTDAVIEHDRADAIAKALAMAGPGDLVLVAGKGHEDYQERQGVRVPFSDQVVISKLLGEGAP